ncbi:MAG: glycosyltransferase family 2 protein [Acidaminococcaceae bacterium]|nr:glycosyltransferase family 2 protein [Acidaminococcaceae bacterium]
MEKVSIIIATYHRYNLLPRAVRSAVNQTYKNVEIIVVDDNPEVSPERSKTAEVMKTFIRNYPQVKYIQNKKNSGGAVTRNNGLQVATGSYIAFLDDDDEYLPQRIEIQLNEMLKNNWDACAMDGATYDDKDKLISEKKQHFKNGMTQNELMRIHMLYHISGTNTFMFKAEKLRAIGGFDDLPACQEYVLMQKAIEADFKIGYVNKTLVKNHISKGERLSTSLKKIPAQNLLIKNKKKHFDLLTKEEKNAVLCRHYGVLFNIYLKNRRFINALFSLTKCILISPANAVRWGLEYKDKIGA